MFFTQKPTNFCRTIFFSVCALFSYVEVQLVWWAWGYVSSTAITISAYLSSSTETRPTRWKGNFLHQIFPLTMSVLVTWRIFEMRKNGNTSNKSLPNLTPSTVLPLDEKSRKEKKRNRKANLQERFFPSFPPFAIEKLFLGSCYYYFYSTFPQATKHHRSKWVSRGKVFAVTETFLKRSRADGKDLFSISFVGLWNKFLASDKF